MRTWVPHALMAVALGDDLADILTMLLGQSGAICREGILSEQRWLCTEFLG